MAFKAAGAPCDLMREHILLNSGSFSTTANSDSGHFRLDAITEGMPSRLTHVHDNTAFSTQPKSDSWETRLRQGWTPANTKGDGGIGALT